MSDLYWLTDKQRGRLGLFFPKSCARVRLDDCRVLSAIIFVNWDCLRWRDAPRGIWPTQDTPQPLEALERHGVPQPEYGRSEYLDRCAVDLVRCCGGWRDNRQ